jgi:hypothetical protein
MKPMKRWDDGRAVLVSGDAAGVGRASFWRGHLLRYALWAAECQRPRRLLGNR